jgi:2-polyprenyl-3-methyl-5-hydroxy-6-metoxy-1,4-benzoquinol methylase
MLLEKLADIIFCPLCGRDKVKVINNRVIASCCNTVFKLEEDQIIIFDDTLLSIPEVRTRDDQAERYLMHSKFPTQISRMQRWISNIPKELLAGTALDLGCGPGPTTRMLLEVGTRNILSADFSINSLRLNKDTCQYHAEKPIYILQDIRDTKLRENSISVLVMADFLQHITDKNERDDFLNKAIKSLIPGGYFFLSFFNINIKNYLKNDIIGSFASGTIKYERLNYKKVISSLPDNVIIDRVIPMNISNHAVLDRLLCSLPFSNFFSRMVVIQGRKISDDN